jgi:hypothetical protein
MKCADKAAKEKPVIVEPTSIVQANRPSPEIRIHALRCIFYLLDY